MNSHQKDPISQNEVYLSVLICSSNKSNQKNQKVSLQFYNQIFLSRKPVLPIILIQGLRFYYTPSDISNYILKFGQLCNIADFFLNSLTKTFVILLKTDSISKAELLMSKLKSEPYPSSLDVLDFQYVHSVDFKSNFLIQRYENLLNSEKLYDDSQCPICLYPLKSEQLSFILPCSHFIHAKCMEKMSLWKCPCCRDMPTVTTCSNFCEICKSDSNLFSCLRCGSTFCKTHCTDHFKQTKHAYLASADGRETWNMMTDSSMKRVAIDKSGEYVEMCAKEDTLGNYLDSALEGQIIMHQSLGQRKIEAEHRQIEEDIKQLNDLIVAKKKIIEEKKKLICEKNDKEKRLEVSLKILDSKKLKIPQLPEDIGKLEAENDKLKEEISTLDELINDTRATVSVRTFAKKLPKGQKLHVRFNQNQQQSPPPH